MANRETQKLPYVRSISEITTPLRDMYISGLIAADLKAVRRVVVKKRMNISEGGLIQVVLDNMHVPDDTHHVYAAATFIHEGQHRDITDRFERYLHQSLGFNSQSATGGPRRFLDAANERDILMMQKQIADASLTAEYVGLGAIMHYPEVLEQRVAERVKLREMIRERVSNISPAMRK